MVKYGNFDRVTFGEKQYVTGDRSDGRYYTSCFLNQTEKHTVGQFQTGQLHDKNFRIIKNRRGRGNQEPASKAVVNNHHTYHYYTKGEDPLLPDRVSVGIVLSARLESIGVNVLQKDEISGTFLNYCDAALLELYREAVGKETLQGTCERRPRLGQCQNQDDDIDGEIESQNEEQSNDNCQNDEEQSDEEETDEEESSEEETD